jgi:glycyl-tRNA synthetase beta chain
VSVALADKLDTLTRFFAVDERPTGSSDPFALRRAALGVIRIILENQLELHLNDLIESREDVFDFIIDRLRVKLRSEGERFDILDAVLGNRKDDDLLRIMQLVDAVRDFLFSEDGRNLLVAYRRASNILKIEDAKDGPHRWENFRADLEQQREERELGFAIGALRQEFYGYGDTPAGGMLELRKFKFILENFAKLRAPVDAFFDKVTVNAAEPEIRRNRLSLLAQLRDTMHQIADFSKIEG